MPDVTCLKEKKSLTAEPWGELLITVLVLLVGREGLRCALCQLLAPLQEGLQEPNEVDVGEGESEEKEEDVKPTSNGKDCDCTVVGGLLTSSSCLGEQLM